jgi:polysaccharide chain length determinant protein (PEP-CTERM system associated)
VITKLNLYPELRRTEPIEAIVERMRRDIDLRTKVVDQPSGRAATIAFMLSYSGQSPVMVATVTNTLASFYVEENSKRRERQADQTAGFLKEQLVQVKAELDAQERSVGQFASTHTDELPQQVQANLGALERLNTQLRLNGEYQLRAMERRERLDQTPAVAPPPPVVVPQTPLSKAKDELAELRRQFSDQYPDVIRAKAHIANLEKQLRDAGVSEPPFPRPEPPRPKPQAGSATQAPAARVEEELRALKEQETLLRQMIARYETRVESAPHRQQEIQALSRGSEGARERYQLLLKQYQEAEQAATVEQRQSTEQFRILDAAIPPRRPIAPNRMWLAAMGILVSFALALGATVVAERLDTTFHTVDDLRAFIDVPAVGSIRRIVTGKAKFRRRFQLAFIGMSFIVGLALVVAGSYRLSAGNEQIVRLTARGGV